MLWLTGFVCAATVTLAPWKAPARERTILPAVLGAGTRRAAQAPPAPIPIAADASPARIEGDVADHRLADRECW